MGVKASDIVDAARLLLGAPYRWWTDGAPVPMWLYDKAGDPPSAEHLRAVGVMCFPGQTKVLAPGIQMSYRRVYSGELVTIKTASGNELSGTPNHPILSRRGWVALGELKKGDRVFRGLDIGKLMGSNPDYQGEPTPIQEVHDLCSDAGSMERIPGIPFDFHGDGRDGEVDVVFPDRELRNRRKPLSPEKFGKLRLSPPHLGEVPLVSLGVADEVTLRPGPATRRLVGGTGLGFALAGSGLGVSKARCFGDASANTALLKPVVDHDLRDAQSGGDLALGAAREVPINNLVNVHGDASCRMVPELGGLGLAAQPDSGTLEAPLDGLAGNTKASGDGANGLPFGVAADKIIGIQRKAFSGDVYNLQTESDHYIANGIVAHNCSDLCNFACQANGLPAVGGTGAWNSAIVDWQPFDPNTPGEPGAVAVLGYTDPWRQGHLGIYTGEHTLIQAIHSGVTEDYTDAETYSWGGDTAFRWYGKIPGVTYGAGEEPANPVPAASRAWIAWSSDGVPSVNGADCSGGWRWVKDL